MGVIGIFFLSLLGIFVLLFIICFVRTLMIRPIRNLDKPSAIDEEKAQQYANHLAEMLKIDTVNIGDTNDSVNLDKIELFHKRLEELYPNTFQTCEKIDLGRGPLLLKLKGTNAKAKPILMMAHCDVVPAPGDWLYGALAGKVADGCIWGRGAIDNKGLLCAMLESVETLIQEGFVPETDVYLFSSNNEEVSGDGAPRCLQYFQKHNIELALAMDEGGFVLDNPLPGVSGNFAMIGIMEKGQGVVRFSASSNGGHSSSPPPNSPITRLSDFVSDIEHRSPFTRRITTPVRNMFDYMTPYLPLKLRFVFANLWLFSPMVVQVMSNDSATAAAFFRTTCVFTMSSGSDAPNVIPNKATVTANLRYMITDPMEQSLTLLEERARQFDIQIENLRSGDPSPFVDVKSDAFQYVLSCLSTVYPDAGAIPYVTLGATDSRHFAPICPCIIRFAPFHLSVNELKSIHSVDEHINIDTLAHGVDFYTNIIKNYHV